MRNIHLTPQLVQAVRDAVDVVAVASDHTKVAKRGHRWVGLCPLHKEKSPSFSVDPDRGLFYCFGCGAGGDAIKLHMLTTGDDFPAAIETLALRYGIPLPAVAPERRGPGGGRDRGIQPALEAAHEFFRRALSKSSEARSYLERRRIPEDLIERFGLGYAPQGWQELTDALERKIPRADLEAAGLTARSERDRPYDRFRHRLMFPIFTASNRLVGFGGRTLGDDKAKYVNTAETDEFHKSRLLYGLNLAKKSIREAGKVLLVEGYFDVIGAVASGIEWTVASMGTSLTTEQAKLLARYAEDVVVGYDGDNAGEGAFRRAVPILLAEGLAVQRARFGAGEDPDSLRLAKGQEAVFEAVNRAEDGVLGEIDRLCPAGAAQRPHDQSRAATAVADLLRPIRDSIVRLGYCRMAAGRLGLPAEMLWQRLQGGSPPVAEGRTEKVVRPNEVRSLEEQVLALLLSGGTLSAVPLDLPDEQAFFDAVNRNIYRAFSALYTSGEGSEIGGGGLRARLEDDVAVARLAKILVEEPVASEKTSLPALLDKLRRRWQKQRIQDLTKEIGEAQRLGDRERLARLLETKTALSQHHHRSPLRGSMNPQR